MEEFKVKTLFQTRLSVEEADEMNDRLIDICPDVELNRLNAHIFLMRCFNLAIGNVKKTFVSSKEDIEKIQNLTKEIERLTSENASLSEIFDQKTAWIRTQEEEAEKLKAKIAELESQLNQATGDLQTLKTSVPADNVINLDVTPKQKLLIETTCARLSEKLKQTLKPGKFLFHLFWIHYVRQESDPPFPFVIKSTDFQKQHQQDNE